MICPRCQLEQADGSSECPRCGVLFARLHATGAAGEVLYVPRTPRMPGMPGTPGTPGGTAPPTAGEKFADLLFAVPETVSPAAFYGRLALAAFLFLWGLRFLFSSVADDYVASSFLHLVNLPFHEAGHILFLPFGDFLHALGGTLGQLLVPLICLAAFLLYTGDTFGAAVTLWWLGRTSWTSAPISPMPARASCSSSAG